MKIGILTYHRSHNYGAFLQAYSLSNALNNVQGITCEIINYNLKSEDTVYKKRKYKRPIYFPIYLKQDRMFEREQDNQLLSGKLIIDNGFKEVLDYANQKYDVVISGSDEIWRIASRGFPNIYWQPGKYDFVKMSYAASGRMSMDQLSEDTKIRMEELYRDFAYVGVRDKATKMLIEEICKGKEIHRNCDPAFLYDRFKPKSKLRDEICEKWKLNKNKKIVAIMYDRPEIISKLRKKLGTDYQFVCIARPMWNADKNLCSVTPFEWVDIIGGCDFLLSSYFHGMLFAINQNTPFAVIDRRANNSNLLTSKLYDFLDYVNMKERYNIAGEMNEESWTRVAEQIKTESVCEQIDFTKISAQQKALFDEFLDVLRNMDR